ncbi:MAG: ice-binding family protein [Candidatus Cloacimonadales bacterium]
MKKTVLFISMFLLIASSILADGPATVNLGTAENYVILAKTGISSTGTTDIVGDLGLSPASASYITGFDLIMDPSGTYSTSALVTGEIFAADYTSPTPSNLTTAVSDMETAYTDAAGRVNPDFTELYAGDLTGQTLVPGLYNWSSGVLISAAGLTIAGSADDIWIFQISQNLTVADGAIITLSGGAQAANIFWQIAGQASIGTTAQFKGIILGQTMISLNTNATLNGRVLSQTAVTLDGNNVVEPSNLTEASDDEIPFKTSLIANYPNPFNPETTIVYNLQQAGYVSLEVINIRGQKVKSLVNEHQEAGTKSIVWNGLDDNNQAVSSGIYFYLMKAGENFSSAKKMILLK